METKEKVFKGFTVNGFAMMFVAIALLAGSIWLFSQFDLLGNASVVLGIVGVFLFVLLIPGFFSLEPNEARVMVFFGKYKGTFKNTGFFWVNPFFEQKDAFASCKEPGCGAN